MKKHFVTFYSAGTFVDEETTKEINSWDINKAVAMSKTIKERYGATPFGFQFFTRERKPRDFDSKIIKRSTFFYLGGNIFTLKEIKDRKDPKDRILIANMEGNKWNKIIVNDNSWRVTKPLNDDDIVLDYKK